MKITDIEIDVSKLLSKDELLKELKEKGESDSALVAICDRYYEEFGSELIWHYPLCDGDFAGFTIVVVKEGFLKLPYDYMDKEEREIFELESATLAEELHLENLIDNWKSYSDNLLKALGDMVNILRG